MRHEYLSVYNLVVESISVGGGKLVKKQIDFAVSKTSGSYSVFTISGGAVRAKILGLCDTNLIGAGAGALVSLGVPGALTSFIAATTASGVDADEFWVATTAHVKQINTSALLDKIINQASVKVNVSGTSMTSGKITFYAWWEPVKAGAKLVAA